MSILAIGTHPDDIEIGCGGTIRRLAEEDQEITFLIMTDGRAGSFKTKDKDLVAIRKNEAIASAQVLGVKKVIFFELPDGLVSFSRSDKVRMIELIRELKPETVFVHAYDDHFPDHKVVRSLVLNAIQVSGGPWYSEVSATPHRVKNIYGYEVWNPINQFQLAVDISSFMKHKLEALGKHVSQVSDINYLGGVKGLAMYRGAMSGKGKFAEVFEINLLDNLV